MTTICSHMPTIYSRTLVNTLNCITNLNTYILYAMLRMAFNAPAEQLTEQLDLPGMSGARRAFRVLTEHVEGTMAATN